MSKEEVRNTIWNLMEREGVARFLVGEITDVVGMSATFIKERPLPIDMKGPTAAAGTQRGKVTVDDGVAFFGAFRQRGYGYP